MTQNEFMDAVGNKCGMIREGDTVIGDEEIDQIIAEINMDYIEQLKNYNYEWKEETFLYVNEENKVDIKIKYPVLNIPGYPNITECVNQNIQETAFFKMPERKKLDELENFQMQIEYQIESAAEDFISIRFDGRQNSDDEQLIFTMGSTSNILDGGKKAALHEVLGDITDLKKIEKSILESEVYSEEEKRERIARLKNNDTDYFVTPCYICYCEHPNPLLPNETCGVSEYARKWNLSVLTDEERNSS